MNMYLQVREAIPLKLPLFLTIGRIFLSPVFLLFYLYYQKWGISLKQLPFVLFFLFLISELSDFFDGYLARKLDRVTNLGKILDPMADSITRVTMLLAFTQGFVRLPLILIFIFLYRDAIISTLRTLCALKGIALAARLSGKIKAVMQAITILIVILLMIPYSWGLLSLEMLRLISIWAVSITAFYALFSGGEYLYAHRHDIKWAWKG